MLYKFRVMILSFIMCLFMTETTNCQEFYYYIEKDNSVMFVHEKLEDSNDDITVKIENVILMLINSDKTLCIPEGTKLLDVNIIGDYAILNFNENILNYGGNYYEHVLLNQIYKNVLQFDEINSLSILVNSKVENFPEGHVITNVTSLE